MVEPGKKEKVERMFDDISRHYDFLNHFLSLGADYFWRRKLVKVLAGRKPEMILDVATGTGDVAISLSRIKPVRIKGIDIAGNMLEVARLKVREKALQQVISFETGDAENIPFPDGSFDAVTVAFGVRNFEDLAKGLREMHRVLKPGGSLLILEFSHPEIFPVRQLYWFYARYLIPFIGRLISKHAQAYQYLPDSVTVFPYGKDFLRIMEQAGLKNTRHYPLSFGISTIYCGEKSG